MILHPNPTSKPYAMLMEMFRNGIKVAELDITGYTHQEVQKETGIQYWQGRTVKFKIIKPYNWPSFDEGKEVER